MLQTTRFIRRVIDHLCLLLLNGDVDIMITMEAAGEEFLHFTQYIKGRVISVHAYNSNLSLSHITVTPLLSIASAQCFGSSQSSDGQRDALGWNRQRCSPSKPHGKIESYSRQTIDVYYALVQPVHTLRQICGARYEELRADSVYRLLLICPI